jgi:glycosyltransferase involved in cell wall biosynthesis
LSLPRIALEGLLYGVRNQSERPSVQVNIFPPIAEDHPFDSVRLYARNLLPVLIDKGVEATEVPFSRRFQPWMPSRINGPLNRYLVHPLYAARRQGRINHVLDHAYGHLAFALDPRRTIVSCNSMSIPKAIDGQIPGFKISPALKASMWLRHKGMLRCARVVACSHALKNDIVRFFRCDPSQVSVVHDGINHSMFRRLDDPARLQALVDEYRLPTDGTRLVMVVSAAGGGGYKNKMATLRTQHALVRRGEKTLLVLVGAPLTESEQAFVNDHDLHRHVASLGRVSWDALVGLYNLADVFLFPSWDEGFGYPPIEAMACGAPVVVSDIPVLLETTGGIALAAAPDDADALADRIQQILNDASLARRMREDGLKQAQRYSWTRYADEILEVYREVADVTH